MSVNKRIKADEGTERYRNGKKSVAMSAAKRQYLENKRKVLEREKNNYTELILLKGDGPWWKLLGHSAVIYKYRVAERLKKPARLVPDSDYNERSEEGVVSFQNAEKLEKDLKTLKIYVSKRGNAVWVFDLGERVEVEDYLAMAQRSELEYEKANKLIMPVERYPEVRSQTRELLKLVWTAARKMDGVARDVFALEMSQKMVDIEVKVMRATRGTADVDEVLLEALNAAEYLYGCVTTISDLRLLEGDKVGVLARAIVGWEKELRHEIEKRAKAKAEAELAEKIKGKTGTNGEE